MSQLEDFRALRGTQKIMKNKKKPVQTREELEKQGITGIGLERCLTIMRDNEAPI